MTDELAAKRELRARLRQALAAIPPEQRARRSAQACERALAGDLFAPASTVMVYAPMLEQGEIDLAALAEGLFARRCRLCAPHVNWKSGTILPGEISDLMDLVPDPLLPGKGIRVPRPGSPDVPVADLDVVVVPGLGFDLKGGRIGRGGGFYDRFLGGLPGNRPLRLALAFDEQVVESVPREIHDAPIHVVVTPTRLLRVG